MAKKKNEDTLIAKVLTTYNMTYSEFSKYSGIPQGTLEGYRNKLSKTGEILLNMYLKQKELIDELSLKEEQLVAISKILNK